MKISVLLKNIIVYTFVYNINRSLIGVFSAYGYDLTRDVNSIQSVELDISNQSDSVYYTYSKSADSSTHVFEARDGFSIKDIKVTDKKTGKSEHLWWSPRPASNAYKVIGYSVGKNANLIQIHLLDNAVSSVYSTYFSTSPKDSSVEESIVILKDQEDKPVAEPQDSSDTSKESTVNYKLLYILLPTILVGAALVISVVSLVVYTRKRRNSSNLLAFETSV